MSKLLISAYACEPYAGSEYGVGWNIAVNLAKHHTVYVLTRSRCRDKIENELTLNPISNLHFLFYDIPSIMYYKNEIGSNWGEQYNYTLWQIFVKKLVRKHIFEKKIDIIHHITFNQYRTPSPGFFLKTPFVIGPIGGAETIANCFAQDLDAHTLKKEKIRKKGLDLNLFGWWCKGENKKHIFCSSKENMERLTPYKKKSTISILPAIAFDPHDFKNIAYEENKDECFEMIYAGKLYDWKGVQIFLRAVKKGLIDNGYTNFRIKLIGLRFEEEQQRVKKWLEELNLNDFTQIVPFVNRPELLNLLSICNLSVYPAFRDSGSMSVLEASVLGCPTICFDAGGQDAFPNDVLIKVPVFKTYEETLNAFSEKLSWCYINKALAKDLGYKAKEFVYQNLTWESKIESINKIYKEILK